MWFLIVHFILSFFLWKCSLALSIVFPRLPSSYFFFFFFALDVFSEDSHSEFCFPLLQAFKTRLLYFNSLGELRELIPNIWNYLTRSLTSVYWERTSKSNNITFELIYKIIKCLLSFNLETEESKSLLAIKICIIEFRQANSLQVKLLINEITLIACVTKNGFWSPLSLSTREKSPLIYLQKDQNEWPHI